MYHVFHAFARPVTWKRIALSLCCAWLLILLAACETASTAQTTVMATPTARPHPTVTPTSTSPPVLPPSRGDTQLVYDDQMKALLLIEGSGSGSVLGLTDMWAWNGETWTQLHPAHMPLSRSDAAIAYDAATHQVVLFGGGSNEGNTPMLADTWTWDGTDWTQQHPTVSPPARDFAGMAYDAATGQMLLFGGGGNGPRIAGLAPPSLGDTWDWTGTNWVQLHPATVPAARTQPGMAYDAATREIVLFGGNDVNANGPHGLNDTWVWNGLNWIQLHPSFSPPLTLNMKGETIAFEQPVMTYNTATQQIMMVQTGVDEASNTFFDLGWFWNGSHWTPPSGIAAGSSDGGLLVYDAAIQAVVEWTSTLPVINGVHSDVFEDKLWQWNGQSWKLLEDWGQSSS